MPPFPAGRWGCVHTHTFPAGWGLCSYTHNLGGLEGLCPYARIPSGLGGIFAKKTLCVLFVTLHRVLFNLNLKLRPQSRQVGGVVFIHTHSRRVGGVVSIHPHSQQVGGVVFIHSHSLQVGGVEFYFFLFNSNPTYANISSGSAE